MATYALDFDTAKLAALGIKLEGLTGADMGKAITTSLNDVVDKAYDLSRKRMITGINLTDAYLRRKMVLTQATAAKPTASILAVGTMTQLSQFQAEQEHKPVNWSNSRITGMGKKFGKWPGWTRRTGNTPIGIPVDRKADGRSASIKRGARAPFKHAFALAGKADTDGNLLMFTRKSGSSKTRTLLGPAVYQLFKYQFKGTLLGETEEMLSTELATQVQAAIEKALDK